MKKKLPILIVIILLAAGIWHFFLRDDPETQIKKRLSKLAETVGKNGKESAPKIAFKNEYLSTFFADHVEIEGNVGLLAAKESNYEITNRIISARNYMLNIDLSFFDHIFEWQAEDHVAIRAKSRLRMRKSSENPYQEKRELLIYMKKIDSSWKIYKLKVSDVLEY